MSKAWAAGSGPGSAKGSAGTATAYRCLRSASVAGLLPDRDVLAALARERLALPAAPAVSEPHSGELSHEIEFRGPRVPERHRQEFPAPVDEIEVMRGQALARDVVLVDAPVRVAPVEDDEPLSGREPLQVRESDLDHEAAAGLEVRGDIAETCDLLVLARQVRDRVVDEVGERERPVHVRRREVADRDADLLAARLLAQPRDHRSREIDAVHRHAPLCQRKRDPPRPDPQLEGASVPGQLDEQLHDRVDRVRLEHLPAVVAVGDALVEEAVVVHGPNLCAQARARPSIARAHFTSARETLARSAFGAVTLRVSSVRRRPTSTKSAKTRTFCPCACTSITAR